MILIKNAKIIDGTGYSPFYGDIIIQGDKIAAIGSLKQHDAEIVVDGTGLIVTPGFIDINSSSDHFLSLFSDPSQSDFVQQGVTTIIGGNDGSSLAPLLYGTLESIRKWGSSEVVNVDWKSVDEFLSRLSQLKLGLNFGTLVGHGTIRRSLIGEVQRELTIAELSVFKKIVIDALDQGAFGLSTGLGFVHAQQTPYREIEELAYIVRAKNALYTTHLRNEEEGLLASIEEVLHLAQNTGVGVHINHLRPLLGFEKDYQRAMSFLEAWDSRGMITFDAYPFDVSILPLYKFLPKWAQAGNLETMNQYLHSPSLQERFFEGITKQGLESIRVVQAPGNEYAIGQTLEDFARNRNMPSLKHALIELMKTLNLQGTVFYKNINLDLLQKYFSLEQMFVGSNVASLSNQFPQFRLERFNHVFPRFLEIVLDRGEIPLEKAVKRLTFDPAQKVGLVRRGLIREGWYADLVLWKLGKKIVPEHTIVNGRFAYHNRQIQNVFAGKVLRKK